jgi:hypothetical protein
MEQWSFQSVLFWTIYILKFSPDLANCSLWVIEVTSQICCHCSYITKLKCSLWPKYSWPKFVTNVVTTVLQFLYSHLQMLSQWLQFPFRCFGEIRFEVSDTIKMQIDGVTFHMLWIHRKKWYLLNSIESKAIEKITSMHVIQCWFLTKLFSKLLLSFNAVLHAFILPLHALLCLLCLLQIVLWFQIDDALESSYMGLPFWPQQIM